MFRQIIILLVVLCVLLLPNSSTVTALTLETVGTGPGAKSLVTCNSANDIAGVAASGNGFFCLVSMSYKIFFSVIALLGIAVFVILLIGGLKYITAGGDEKSMQSAKKTMTYGGMGIAIALASVFLFIVLNDVILKPGGGLSPFRLMVPDWLCTKDGKDNPALGGICNYK